MSLRFISLALRAVSSMVGIHIFDFFFSHTVTENEPMCHTGGSQRLGKSPQASSERLWQLAEAAPSSLDHEPPNTDRGEGERMRGRDRTRGKTSQHHSTIHGAPVVLSRGLNPRPHARHGCISYGRAPWICILFKFYYNYFQYMNSGPHIQKTCALLLNISGV